MIGDLRIRVQVLGLREHGLGIWGLAGFRIDPFRGYVGDM